MNRVPFEYFAIRCMPRVDRGEFVNVGVVLYSQDADFLGARSELSTDRLAALAAGVDVEAVSAALATIEAVCRGDARVGEAGSGSLGKRFGWLAAPRSTALQPGPVHGGLTDDPAAELERLLDVLVR
ncbi:MAG: DUF3037 domain-containing protein [Acidothermaceae bacterium]